MEERLGKEVDAIIAPITPTAAVRHKSVQVLWIRKCY